LNLRLSTEVKKKKEDFKFNLFNLREKWPGGVGWATIGEMGTNANKNSRGKKNICK